MSKFTEIDLRSDTVTKPTSAMRQAMCEAEVGDDVLDVDPTVQRLEQATAAQLGKEAAVFMPSGTMTNQIALRVHCRPGDEFLCDVGCHILNYEQGGFAQLSGLVARPLHGDHGILRLRDVEGQIRPTNDHLVSTRLITIENTHNRGAGTVQPFDEVLAISEWAAAHGLLRHLDGARLFNAAVATGRDVSAWSNLFDTVSVCFSKGLGAPVGSVLAGDEASIRVARRHRKLFGGAMRQAGIVAAAALYALQHHVDRLAEDHRAAQVLARAVRDCDGLRLCPDRVDTNMVIWEVDQMLGTAHRLVETLEQHGVRVLAVSPHHIRAVTHLGVSLEAMEHVTKVLPDAVNQLEPV